MTPVTSRDDSCVTFWQVSKTEEPTSGWKATACRYPVPSRTIRKASFPFSRLLYSQPRTRTSCPSWAPMVLMVVVCMNAPVRGGNYRGRVRTGSRNGPEGPRRAGDISRSVSEPVREASRSAPESSVVRRRDAIMPPPDPIVLRLCGAGDRASVERLGHPPAVAAILCPSLPRRMAWRVSGTRAVSVAAVERRTGAVLGCVQFLRSRRSPHTWLFGHWRVAPAVRKRGIGRRLLLEGVRGLTGARRLYSYVEWDNEGSKEAHARLGFESGSTLRGSAPLGALSTIGAA